MKTPIVVRPLARDDLAQARDWYEERGAGKGQQFVSAVEEFLDRISTFPEIYAVEAKNVRCGRLRRFPYVVYYRILEGRIEILAVLHGSRKPRVWRSRL